MPDRDAGAIARDNQARARAEFADAVQFPRYSAPGFKRMSRSMPGRALDVALTVTGTTLSGAPRLIPVGGMATVASLTNRPAQAPQVPWTSQPFHRDGRQRQGAPAARREPCRSANGSSGYAVIG